MLFITLLATVAGLGVCAAADKPAPGPARGDTSDANLKLEAVLYMEKAAIKQVLGEEMTPGFYIVEVKITPVIGKKVNVSRDDFILRSDRDGQRATPYAPSQVAGSSVLMVKTGYSGGSVAMDDRGPSWGGIGGMPQRLPGNNPTVGNTASQESAVATVSPETGKTADSPLLVALKKRILEEKETETAIGGQLYFLVDGKQKVKDLELLYKTVNGRLSIRFR